MLTSILLPDEWQLCIDRIGEKEGVIVISVSSITLSGLCPCCQTISERVHSSYERHPADVSLAGCSVRLDIAVRRFFCDNDECERSIFAERIPSLIAPYARRTNRLAHQQQKVAFALGGEAGAVLLTIMGMAVSPDTLLRLIRKAPETEVTTPRVLGVDDWSKRKGHSYGTILVDLEAHRTVDLLPDRSAESFAKWLTEHTGVEIISRDRGSEYIKGATDGAPDAIQVADRWHLLANLRDALKRLLESKCACLKAAAGAPKPKELSVQQGQSDISQKLTKKQKDKLARQEKRLERYRAVLKLHEHGFTQTEIAHRLSMSPKTIRKYIRADECPMYPKGRTRRSKLDPYKEYISQRWQAGCHNATQILHEIRQLGFKGSRSIMMEWVSETLRPPRSASSQPQSEKVVPWSASRASWLLIRDENELEDDDKQALERMKQADDKVAEAHILGQRFVQMVRERQSEALLPWLEDATKSGIEALKQFAKGIEQDLDAVANALSLSWSNGQTEGQVNRLKLIKRQMYGRANFDLLRKRVIGGPVIWDPG